jgi:hypothetical protein
VSWIPGWDAATSAGWWSGFYFWSGITCLLLLGVSEVISHRYSERKDELVAEEQVRTQREHDDEIARLHLETAKANEEAARIRAEVAWRRLERPQYLAIRAAVRAVAPIKVIVEFEGNDPEAALYASDLIAVFEDGFATVVRQPSNLGQDGGLVPKGLRLEWSRKFDPSGIENAFTTTGVRFSAYRADHDADLRIHVGHKQIGVPF